MGPHPAVAEVRRAVRAHLASLPTSRTVMVACSGGADSLALAAATVFETERSGHRAGLVTVDHGIQEGSAQRALGVARLGFEMGFDPVEVLPVEVDGDGGLEAAARTARYQALGTLAAALDAVILLGHTLDDQAETVLLGLGRGSGPRSIAGMRPVDDVYHRPLLRLRRDRTAEACAALGLTPWDDPHNVDPRFQRSRLRSEVLPLLEDVLQGGVAEALARTADLVQSDLDALDDLAAGIEIGTGLDVKTLANQPTAIRTRLVRHWAHTHGAGPLTAGHIDALDALITSWHGQRGVDLPGGYVVRRESGRLVIAPPRKENQDP